MKNQIKQVFVILCCMFFSCNAQENPKIIGKWDGSLKDAKTGKLVEKIILEFTKDGQFLQHLGEGKMQHTIISSYKIEKDKIITVEKESQEKSECNYTINKDTLTLLYDGISNQYIKLK
jgi:hypothetical protein